MSELFSAIEDCRVRLGLSQKAVASAVGISQAHYSKVVGGLAGLPKGLEGRMSAWLAVREEGAVGEGPAAGFDEERIRQLAASIESQLRELNRLLGVGFASRKRRLPSVTRRRIARATD